MAAFEIQETNIEKILHKNYILNLVIFKSYLSILILLDGAQMLVNRLKQLMEQKHRVVEQEHEITDEQIEIQAILEAKAREQERAMSIEQPPPDYSAGEPEPEPEALPVPAAMIHDQQHPGKRHGVNTVSCEYFPSLCSSSLQRGDAGSRVDGNLIGTS